jgi:hypothetical protein
LWVCDASLGAAGFEGGEDLVGVERRVGFRGLDGDQRDVDRVAADARRAPEAQRR